MSLSYEIPSSTLQEIYQEIYNLSTIENFSEGWKVIEERNGRCSIIAYQVLAVTGGVFAVAFSATSIMFGTLAGVQGIEDHKKGKNPYVIGHFSEWTMLGLSILGWSLKAFNEVALLGGASKERKIFHRVFQEGNLSKDQRHLIYQDYLAFFKSQPRNYFTSHQFPILPENLSFDLHDSISIDHQLREVYIEIEHKLSSASTFSDIRKGLSIVKSSKSQYEMALIKTTMVMGGVFLMLNIANYTASIYWSGKQSYNDYEKRVNPNVGGHSLEWSVEALATVNVVIYYMNELANVGRVKTIVEVFHRTIDSLKEDSYSSLVQAKERLHAHMEDQVRKLPQGWFFNIPSWLMFNASEPI